MARDSAIWAKRYAKEVHEVEVPYNEAIDPAAVVAALKQRPETSIVSAVHHDTPSGTLNPIREIGRVVREHGALLLVDAVSSFAGMDIHPDDCNADIFVTGPGKCLGGPPGVTLLAVSARAWEHIAANPDTPRDSVLSLLDWKEAWRRDKPFPFTPSVAEVNALDAALDGYLEEGPETVWARHALAARACRAGLKAMKLPIWPASEAIAAPTTTAVRVPAGIKISTSWRRRVRMYGLVFSRGRGETLGKLLRIGHMGPVAEPGYVSSRLPPSAVRCGISATRSTSVPASRPRWPRSRSLKSSAPLHRHRLPQRSTTSCRRRCSPSAPVRSTCMPKCAPRSRARSLRMAIPPSSPSTSGSTRS